MCCVGGWVGMCTCIEYVTDTTELPWSPLPIQLYIMQCIWTLPISALLIDLLIDDGINSSPSDVGYHTDEDAQEDSSASTKAGRVLQWLGQF